GGVDVPLKGRSSLRPLSCGPLRKCVTMNVTRGQPEQGPASSLARRADGEQSGRRSPSSVGGGNMSKNLVIVESAAEERTISKFLGGGYTVEASMGHVGDLPRSQFGVDIEKGFTPKYITVRGQGKTLQELRKAAKKAGRIYLATDPDREGEAISWH